MPSKLNSYSFFTGIQQKSRVLAALNADFEEFDSNDVAGEVGTLVSRVGRNTPIERKP